MKTRTYCDVLGRLRVVRTISSVVLAIPSLAFAQAEPAAPGTASTGATVSGQTSAPSPAVGVAAQPATPVGVSIGQPPAVVDPAAVPVAAGSSTTEGTQPAPAAAEAAAAGSEAESASDTEAAGVAEELSGEAGKLNVYGFADFTYAHLMSTRTGMVIPPSWYPSFYVGNFNVYFGADLGKGWRTLSEVRFTYLPDGVQGDMYGPSATRVSGAYPDYADFNRNVKVGGISIQRAYLDYEVHPLLTIRGGHFLTPYGIWNVEHGTPVIVGTTRPYVIGAELFPTSQTGLEFYGSYGSGSTQVGYHLTLSNGRGPVDTYRDLDRNKALGWRLWLQQDTDFGMFTLGTSGYKGRYTDRMQTTGFANGEVTNSYVTQSEYRELALALDLKWNWKGALIQSEALLQEIAYESAVRPTPRPYAGPPGWVPDTRRTGVYLLGGYRFNWLGLMPYVGADYYNVGKVEQFPDAFSYYGGFNVRPTDRVVLKIQLTRIVFPSDGLGGLKSPPSTTYLTTQAAWSF